MADTPRSLRRYTVPYPPHGSAAWHAARWADNEGRRLVPASSAAALFGQHNYQTPGDLAATMLADAPPVEAERTMAQDRGHRAEPMVARWFTDMTGWQTAKPTVLYRCGRVITTIDYEIPDAPDRHLEVKTDSESYWSGVLPDQWYWQGIAQAYARGSVAVEWAIFDKGQLLYLHTQEVTDAELDRFEARVEEWCAWIDLGMVPPDVTLDYENQATRFARSRPAEVVLPPEAKALWAEKRQLDAQIKADNDRVDDIKAQFAEWLGEARTGVLEDGTQVVTWAPTEGSTYTVTRKPTRRMTFAKGDRS